ncbi:MAG: hypothetical protein LQ343_000525 [Gyalolechia ehrenbergii]|nr:MAG: hypothetical protein LQ343_000525 [Gyalolechia ehrenbergii]
MARLFRSLSSSAPSLRPSTLSSSSTVPESSSTLRKPTLISETCSTPQSLNEWSSRSHTLIRAQWIEGLTQYTDFRLHSALSTFKRLLRDLRSTEKELPSPTTNNDVYTGSAPYGILPPEEIALLYINIALIHGYLGSYYLAAAAFEEALLLDEVSGVAWFGLGVAKFYLRELGASKRAFGKCQACFVTRDEDGERRQKPVLTYKVWTGHSTLEHGLSSGENSNDSKISSGPWQPFKSILSRNFPNGQWTLERPRVEWNWRIALFERNYVRKGVERPGGGKWGLNGIPAGVIFGPASHFAMENTAMDCAVDDDLIGEGSNVVLEMRSKLDGEAKGWPGSLVKRKWSLLQQKIRGRKANAVTPPSSPRRTKSSESVTSPYHSHKQSRFIEGNSSPEKAPPRRVSSHLPGVLGMSLPSTLPTSRSRVHGLCEGQSEEWSVGSDASIGRQATHDMVPLFPRRRSSLVPKSAKSAFSPRRLSSDSMYPMNNAIREIESIEEEPVEDQYTDSLNKQRVVGDLDDRTLENVSPKDMRGFPSSHSTNPSAAATTGRAEDVMLPGSRWYGGTMPTMAAITIPQTAASSRFGSDSFMTDNISPLSSQTRSAMFPHLFDRQSPSSRRPSYATDVWTANSNRIQSEEPGDGGRRRSSAIVTLTPATPERSCRLPQTVNLLDDLVDSYYLASCSSSFWHAGSMEEHLNNEDMAVKPLNVSKKERMSITGRTCLGEWEWEEEYERWRQDYSAATEGDDDDTIGEMLQPRCFEGFDRRS